MQLYAGLDLHSRNTYIGIMDKEFKRVFNKRIANKLPLILATLKLDFPQKSRHRQAQSFTFCLSYSEGHK